MNESLEQYIRGVMSGDRRSGKATVLRGALAIAAMLYSVVVRIRYAMFDWKVRTPGRLPVPVISIGNLTTGGTGKTPVVAWIVEALQAQNRRPAILLRGFRSGRGIASDEQMLYQSRFANRPAVAVLASPKRFAIASQSMQNPSPPDVFVLDDGFQHRQLYRDLDIVLIDATNPFGYGHLLPRGMLRESKQGICRAHAILITRADQIDNAHLQQLICSVKALIDSQPILQCTSALTNVTSLQNTGSIETLRDRKIFAFCGIGNPQSFQRLLERASTNVIALRALNDHQTYSAEMVSSLVAEAVDAGAEMLVTTEKDWMKIQQYAAGTRIPIYSAHMQIQFSNQDTSTLLHLINTIFTNQ